MSWLWVICSWSVAAGLIYDIRRRPESQWVAADRQRSWWVSMAAVGGFFMMGLFVGIVYLVGVLPGLNAAPAIDRAFRKAA